MFASSSWDTPPALLEWHSVSDPNVALPFQVQVRATIGADGRAHEIGILFPDLPGLSWAVVEAVEKWVFRPATKDGAPVESSVVFPVLMEPAPPRSR